jgi:excisionase family DNA binding protein
MAASAGRAMSGATSSCSKRPEPLSTPKPRGGAGETGEDPLSAELLTVTEVCELLRVGPAFVYRHAAELGGVKVGRHLRFRKEAIDSWLDSRKVQDPGDWRSSPTGRKFLSVPPSTSNAGARIRKRAQTRKTGR